jgi:hypothetical protein
VEPRVEPRPDELASICRVLALLALGCSGSSPSSDAGGDAPVDGEATDAAPLAPAVGDSLSGLTFFDGWTNPRALTSAVNTSGWEDSAFIAPGGGRLYFGYTRLNFDQAILGNGVVDGPSRSGEHGAQFDVYEADLGPSNWSVINSTMNSAGDLPEAAQGVDRSETTMVFARFVGDADLWQAARPHRLAPWGIPVLLPLPLNTPCVEDNPHITPEGSWLFFDSDRADAAGTTCKAPGQPRDLWVAARSGDTWDAPVVVAGEPNLAPVRFQPFATAGGADLYWSGYSADCGAAESCVHRARRQSDGSYANATLVAIATPSASAVDGEVIAVGEVSITEDGQWLYFVYRQRLTETTSDLSIGVAGRN